MFLHPWTICLLLTLVLTNYSAAQCTWKDRNPVILRDCPNTGDAPYEADCSSFINYAGSIQCEKDGVWVTPSNGFIINLDDANESPFGEDVKSLIKLTITTGSLVTVPINIYDMLRLTDITITSTELSEISLNKFLPLSNLKRIKLTNNKISVIEVVEISSDYSDVEDIDLSHNMIETIPNNFLGRFREVVHLNLSHNLISSISVHVFEGTVQLNILDLSHNRLHEVGDVLANLPKLYDTDFGAWTNLGKLSKLVLDDNLIANLNFSDFFDTNIKELSIGGNKIPCETLAKVKYSNVSAKFDSIVTAKKLNCHSKNINGISCQNSSNSTESIDPDMFTNYQNPIALLLRNAIENNTRSLNELVKIERKNEERLENITTILQSSSTYHYSSDTKLADIYRKLHPSEATLSEILDP